MKRTEIVTIAPVIRTYVIQWLAAVEIAIMALAMLAVYWSAIPKTVFSLAGLTLVWYWLLPLPFSLIWEGGKGWSDPLAGLLGLVGLGPDEITGNIEMFFVSGITTLLQTTWGNRLPIVQGGTFSFLAPTFAICGMAAFYISWLSPSNTWRT